MDADTNSSLGESEEIPVRKELASVSHDLNNSLSVISGNAQLLMEVARAMELGGEFTEPLDDIEAARTQISEALDRLDRARDRLEASPPETSG